MKKYLSIILALLLSLTLLSSCRYDRETEKPGDETTAEELPEDTSVSFDNKVVYSEGYVTVKAVDMELEGGVYTFNFDIKNDSFNYITLNVSFISVDGIMVDGESSGDVPATSSGKGTLTVNASELDRIGVKVAGEISFNVSIIDTNTYEVIGTSRNNTLKLSSSPESKALETKGETVYDKNNVHIVIVKLKYDKKGDTVSVYTYIENKSRDDLNVGSSTFLINGETNRFPRLTCDIASEKRALCIVTVPMESLTEVGVPDFNAITSVTFDLYGNSTDNIGVFRTGEITVDFK